VVKRLNNLIDHCEDLGSNTVRSQKKMLMHASWIATNVLVFSLSIPSSMCYAPNEETRKKHLETTKAKKKNKILEKQKKIKS